MDGQVDFASMLSEQSGIEEELHNAEDLIGTNNEEATKIISTVIEGAKNLDNITALIKAYTLLGDINANANLNTLAISRYNEALSYTDNSTDRSVIVNIHYKSGSLNYLINSEEAKASFKSCMSGVDKSSMYFLCYEGLANTLVEQDSLDKAMVILDQLEKHYSSKEAKLDTSSLVRIQSRKAIIANSQSRYDVALLNYSNAQTNFRRNKVSAEDVKIINDAKEVISLSQVSVDDEVKFRKSNISKFEKDDNSYQIEDQVRLADAYFRQGDLANASSTIIEAKNAITNSINTTTISKVYKGASEISAGRGDYELALNEYKKYENTQQKLINDQKIELENKIKLLESQQKIDIESNVYDSNRKLYKSESQRGDFQRYLIYLLGLLLLLALLSALWIYRSLRSNRVANKKLELKSLRAQMNPHFIFNALNSVNEYIATQDEVKANRYLTQFSKLMRKVLDVNLQDLIPLSEELELTDLYLKLEHSRFKDQFDYSFTVDPKINNSDASISPMLLQPYIENAIWHGLRYKSAKGFLRVHIGLESEQIHITIEDDGIGRKESLARKTVHQKQHKATGMKNTAKRMSIIEDLYQTKYSINITEAFPNKDDKGTLVKIQLFSADV